MRYRSFVNGYVLLIVWIVGLSCHQTVYSEEVIKISQSQLSQSLNERWEIAKKLADQKEVSGGYWIGYCIPRMMEKHSYIGSYDSRKREAASLFETVYGYKNTTEPEPEYNGCCGSMSGTMSFGDGKSHQEKMIKKIAVLVLFDSKGKNALETKVSNMSLHVELDRKPLIWIEDSRHEESVKLLKTLYYDSGDNEVKEDLVRAIGMHQSSNDVFQFLKDILLSNANDELREETAFWIGQQENDGVLPLLTRVARTDDSEDIREKAIFAISQVEHEAAIDSLISLSRKGHDKETRSKALFWLAEKASKKALKTIKDVLDDDDEDTEVQRQALFALTQFGDDESSNVEELITIAKTHHNRKIRKEAIFWLGQSESDKALDALVEIVKE